MTTKELNKAIETFFSNQKPKECATYETLIELFEKQPSTAQMGNIFKLIT
jgi:RNA polymerase primary sigma factor